MDILDKSQIIIDAMCIVTFGYIAIFERDTGYGMACLYAFIALKAHFDNIRKTKGYDT